MAVNPHPHGLYIQPGTQAPPWAVFVARSGRGGQAQEPMPRTLCGLQSVCPAAGCTQPTTQHSAAWQRSTPSVHLQAARAI